MEREPILVEVSLTYGERVRAAWIHSRPRPLFVVLAAVFLGAPALAAAFLPKRSDASTDLLPIVGALFILAVGSFAWKHWFVRRHTRDAPVRMQLSSDFLTVSSRLGEGRMPMSSFKRWRDHERMILLYQTPLGFIVIPARAVRSPAVLENVRDLLREHVGDPS